MQFPKKNRARRRIKCPFGRHAKPIADALWRLVLSNEVKVVKKLSLGTSLCNAWLRGSTSLVSTIRTYESPKWDRTMCLEKWLLPYCRRYRDVNLLRKLHQKHDEKHHPVFLLHCWSYNEHNDELAHLLDSSIHFIVVKTLSVYMNERTWFSANSAKIWIPLK